MKNRHLSAFNTLALVTTLLLSSECYAATYKLAKAKVQKVGKTTCIYPKKSWVVGTKVSGSTYKTKTGTKAEKAACKSLMAAGKVSSLTQLPSFSKLASSRESTASTRPLTSAATKPSAVSGTPPALPDFLTEDLTTLFWRAGVIDAINSSNASPEQCNEFFGGNSDGHSGGMVACYMTQGVGYSFESMLSTGTSLCYMKNMPTQSLVDEGAIELVSGELPNNDVAQLFNVPSGSADRLVKVLVLGEEFGDQELFIKVHSQNANSKKGNHYAYTLWSCNESGDEVVELENTKITLSGKFISSHTGQGFGGGTYDVVVSAPLKEQDGELVFDPSKVRTAEVASISNSFSFKNQLSITPQNRIKSKSYESGNFGLRKSYSVSEFSGEGLADLRFLGGAYKDEKENPGDGFSGATEFRDTYYASAPNSEYADELNEVDIDSDQFFTSAAEIDFAATGVSCDVEPDVVVSMDMSHSATQAVQDLCEQDRLENMNFCSENESISQANSSWFEVCGGPQE